MKVPLAWRILTNDKRRSALALIGIFIQDRDGAGIVIQAIHDLFPWLRHLFADSVYNGPNLCEALAKFGDWTIEMVTRAPAVTGFHLLPRRWVIERTLAWLNRNRRLAKDFETSITSATTWIYIASTHSFSSGDWCAHSTTYAIQIQTLIPLGRSLSRSKKGAKPEF